MTSMMMSRVRKWMALGSLAVAPLVQAQSTRPVDDGQRASAESVLAATPFKDADDVQIESLKKELDALRAEVESLRARDDRRQTSFGDPDSHPLWP